MKYFTIYIWFKNDKHKHKARKPLLPNKEATNRHLRPAKASPQLLRTNAWKNGGAALCLRRPNGKHRQIIDRKWSQYRQKSSRNQKSLGFQHQFHQQGTTGGDQIIVINSWAEKGLPSENGDERGEPWGETPEVGDAERARKING